MGLVAILLLLASSLASSSNEGRLGGDYWRPPADLAPSASSASPGAVWGLADLHVHLFNHLGFGGRYFHGRVHAQGGMPEALRDCHSSHGNDLRGGVTSVTLEMGHRAGGWPGFEGWPRHDSTAHQHVYVDWLRRAWNGGLRLIQLDVGNSSFLAHVFKGANQFLLPGKKLPLPIDDAGVIELQLAAAREFVAPGGAAHDFAAIAESPAEARKIIQAGKLAIVLGLEVEGIGLYGSGRAAMRARLERLHAAGIRHIIPIHLIPNAFGAPAVYERTFNGMTAAETGTWLELREAFDSGIRFDYAAAPVDLLERILEWGGWWTPGYRAPVCVGCANHGGLTTEGELLLEELMRLGILVDIDHMSERAVERTLTLAERRSYPIIASHTGFRDLSFGSRVSYHADGSFEVRQPATAFGQDAGAYGTSDARKVSNERGRSVEQLRRIRALGGIVGIGLGGAGIGVSWRDRIPLDCDGSSKSFAQSYLYALETMGPDAVAIGSDVNGLAGLPGSRFGLGACFASRNDAIRAAGGRFRAQLFAQQNGVRYAQPIRDARAYRFGGKGHAAAYSSREREVWEAIAYFKAGVDINRFKPRAGLRAIWVQRRIRDIARGFLSASRGEPESRARNANQLAAHRAFRGLHSGIGGSEPIFDVWNRWLGMEGGANPPLQRDFAGERDFDVNLDGMAHYGLLPDFLQDVRNSGVSARELAPLFRSAENFLRTWERVESAAKVQ